MDIISILIFILVTLTQIVKSYEIPVKTKTRRHPRWMPTGLCTLDNLLLRRIPVQECYDLLSCAGLLRTERRVARTIGNAVLYAPRY